MLSPRLLLVLVLAFQLVPGALCAPIVPAPVPPEVVFENTAASQPVFDVEIENRVGGAIVARLPGGVEKRLGSVRRPAHAAQPVLGAFHACYYVRPGIVCATAVNALHVKAGPPEPYDPRRPTENPAVNFNLAPAEVAPGSAAARGARLLELLAPDDLLAPDELTAPGARANEDTIFTDISGGTGIFGGPYAPFTGTAVDVMVGAAWTPLEVFAGAQPTRPLPARIRFRVAEPVRRPEAIEIENWAAGEGPAAAGGAAGRIAVTYPGEAPRVIAGVRKRVRGTGNFEGGQYASVGTLRATHPGVVCFSTAPRGKMGGFQIVPANHARYMKYPDNPRAYQWLVVASVGGVGAPALPGYTEGYLDAHGELNFRPAFEGIAPLFANYLRGSGTPGGQVRLLVRRAGDTAFRPCPEIIGRTEPGLGSGSPVDAFEALRIELPASVLQSIAEDVEADGTGVAAVPMASAPHLVPRDAAGCAAMRRIRRAALGLTMHAGGAGARR